MSSQHDLLPRSAWPAPGTASAAPYGGESTSWRWHLAFWTFLVLWGLVDQIREPEFPILLVHTLTYYALFALVAYVHLRFAVPLVRSGRYAQYAVAVVVLLVVRVYLHDGPELLFVLTNESEEPAWALQEALSVVVLTILICGITVAIERAAAYAHVERRLAERERLERTAQLDRLKAQLNPHFLFNTLNSLYALAVDGAPQLPEYLSKHAALLRYALYDADAPVVRLDQEVDFLQQYVDLERLRLEDEVEVEVLLRGTYDGLYLPPLLFVPLVENAFKYLDRRAAQPFIRIELSVDADSVLHLRLENRALAPEPAVSASPRTIGGVGLRNVRERLVLLYPERHTFTAGPLADRFLVDVTVRLEPLPVLLTRGGA
ncbi:MAG: histidine kinase [Bacteroidota bacterium]